MGQVCTRPTAKNPGGRTGTYAGYQAHLRYRDQPCQPCKTANATVSRTKAKPPHYMRDYVRANRDRLAAYNRERRDDRQEILDRLKDVPCVDCTGRFPAVCMDFDHVRGEKSFSVSRAGTRGLDSVLAEIAKCEVVCANCHRIRTARRAEANRVHPRRPRVNAF